MSVHKYTATATSKMTSQIFSARESYNCCLKAIITVVSHEYRHEFGAACISPTSRPSSSPRRCRSASSSSPATDSFNPNPDQWESNISVLLQVFVVHFRRVQNKIITRTVTRVNVHQRWCLVLQRSGSHPALTDACSLIWLLAV